MIFTASLSAQDPLRPVRRGHEMLLCPAWMVAWFVGKTGLHSWEKACYIGVKFTHTLFVIFRELLGFLPTPRDFSEGEEY